VLATYFKEVEATDISETQLAKAPLLSNISYGVQRAERTNFDDQSFDLITVAQAIHWFDLDAFLKEARRVLRPGGTLAVWGYGLLQFGATCDEQIRHFYTEVVGPYWDGERRHIDSGYVSIPLRLNNARDLNGFRIEKTMNLQSLHGYLTSWSSVQNYMKQHGQNPVDPLIETLRPAWGEGTKTAKFPIFGSFGGV
jgi:SAM-dependent methyltransferase